MFTPRTTRWTGSSGPAISVRPVRHSRRAAAAICRTVTMAFPSTIPRSTARRCTDFRGVCWKNYRPVCRRRRSGMPGSPLRTFRVRSTMLPDSTVQRLRQFACPQEPFDDNAMTRIWDTLIQSTLRAFLDQWHDADPNHRDLANYVAQAPQARPVFEETWDIAYGRIAQGSWDDPHVALDLAAGLAMRRAAAGQPGAWSATFGALRRFRWGHILLPPVDSISVESDGTFATIRTGGGKLRLECRGGEWSG